MEAEATGEQVQVEEKGQVVMEGMLKKRGANLPVMRDRYCVATWELDLALNKYVLLRSYKSRQSYDAHPERPTSVHQLKCISEWDGKTSFHRYEHAFVMETYDKKLFHCVAPSADDKAKWVDLMAIHSAFTSVARGAPATSRDMRVGSIGSLMPLRRASSVDSTSTDVRPRALTGGSTKRSVAAGKPRGVSDVMSTDSEGNGMGDHDALFRSDSTDSSGSFQPNMSNHSSSGRRAKVDRISSSSNDWAVHYGDTLGGGQSNYDASRASTSAAAVTAAMVSKYDKSEQSEEDDEEERQRQSVLLDKKLLRTQTEKNPMASDSFLFDDVGASRFGAVVVKPADERPGESDDDSVDDLVDQELVMRLEREESEKQMKRRAKKLESNRDLYAEMAAARLNDMRKKARQPKKSTPRHHSNDRVRAASMSSVSPSNHVAFFDVESDDGYSEYPDGESSIDVGDSISVVIEKRRKSSAAAHEEAHQEDTIVEGEDEVEATEIDTTDDADAAEYSTQKEKKSKKKKVKSNSVSIGEMASEDRESIIVGWYPEVDGGYGSDGKEQETYAAHKKRSKHKNKHLEEEAQELDDEIEAFSTIQNGDFDASFDPAKEAARLQEEEEERKRAKQKRKEERRARKEKQRQEEEEAAAAAAAAELARQHLESMRVREEEKRRVELEKQEKKERRELKEKLKIEKAKQKRAEAELLKLVEMKKAEEERREQERREKEREKRKMKRRDKYTSPTERIHKMEQEHAAAQSASEPSVEVSNALVVVETAQPAAPTPVAEPSAPVAAVPATVVPAQVEAQAPVSAPAAIVASAPMSAPAAPAPVAEAAAPAFIPAAPQSLPTYASAPTPAPYMPGYPYMAPQTMGGAQGYPYVTYPHLPYPPPAFAAPTSAPASYGVPIPPPYLQPHLGYVSGVPTMPTLPRTFPEAPPVISTVEEKPVMIGPQLPEGVTSTASASPQSSSMAVSSVTLPDLPDLPDVIEF